MHSAAAILGESGEDIHQLWDELADFDPARCDEALVHLMRRLCARIGADNVIWLGVVRADEVGPEDPTGGWRAVTSTLTGLTVCNTASGAMALGIPGFRRARVSRR